jgi:ABC-2 type transport system ATP-binding protein
MRKPIALEARGISKRYGDRHALRGVDLVARPGELHGLLGPNGAGKTTLMRVVFGLVRRDAGTVHVLGQSLDSADGPVPDGVAGFVETPAFYPYLSGRANLALLARLDGSAGRGLGADIDDALAKIGLTAAADAEVVAYSAGMRQRLGLAAALLRSPRLLLLDEPTNSLDPAGAQATRALVRRLASEGTAVVLSSHDMAEVEDLCSSLTILDRGQVVFAGTVEQLRRRAPRAGYVLHTSDDRLALDLAARRPLVRVGRAEGDDGLDVSADVEALDAYVLALGQAGVAVRALARQPRSLESLFLQLTGHRAKNGKGAFPDDARSSGEAS